MIYSFPNTTPFTSGDVMLGMNDQFDSIGSSENFVIFDNLRVVRLDFDIRHVERNGNQVIIDFATSFGTDPASYRLQASTALPGNWVTDTGAVITPTAEGLRATTTATEAVKYFRIVR